MEYFRLLILKKNWIWKKQPTSSTPEMTGLNIKSKANILNLTIKQYYSHDNYLLILALIFLQEIVPHTRVNAS